MTRPADVDSEQAVAWFRRAAEAGSARALRHLGICYMKGLGVALDTAQGYIWLRRAAEAGELDAMHGLGLCYRDGHGVAADVAQGDAWVLRARSAGYVGHRTVTGRTGAPGLPDP